MADVYFIRHGQTDWNEDDKLRGWSDIPLNEDGKKEATQAAQAVKGMKVNHVIAADLPRVIQTARPIAKATNAPLTLDSRYRDMDYGDWTGVPVEKVLPKMLHILQREEGTPPGGSEDYSDMVDRVKEAAAGLFSTASQVPKGSYILISSNRIARTLLSYITDNTKYQTQKDDPIPNAGMIRFAQDPKLNGYGKGEPAFKDWGWEQVKLPSQGPRFGFKEE